MPIATLLLREQGASSLASIVERAQRRKPPLPEYLLQLNSSQLDLVRAGLPPERYVKQPPSSDEGFESDVDTVSLISSEDSAPSSSKTLLAHETDSANGSASSSDSDTDAPIQAQVPAEVQTESHNLVNCVCYTDVKYAHVLVFVINQDQTLVFRFDHLEALHNFYSNFTTFKAISSQKAYSKSFGKKFNLFQRTDKNGVTHIEVKKEGEETTPGYQTSATSASSSIISINTPDTEPARTLSRKKDPDSRQRLRSASIEDIAEAESRPPALDDGSLRKVWNSAEDILDAAPKRPERRRKPKGRAPQPPDVLKGQYVRVNVTPSAEDRREPPRNFFTLGSKPKPAAFQQFRYVEPKRAAAPSAQFFDAMPASGWTSSVPRFLRKPRSYSEPRGYVPMAHRYVDTASLGRAGRLQSLSASTSVSNRLFGMSPKLKDFSGNGAGCCYEDWEDREDVRRSSLGKLTYKINNAGGSLKSVIKKDDSRRKNEKKVTFSAYTTVQVV